MVLEGGEGKHCLRQTAEAPDHCRASPINAEPEHAANPERSPPLWHSCSGPSPECSSNPALRMDWSNELVFEFLDLYENEPVIWNPSHPSHTNRHEMFEAWKRISNQFSLKLPINDLKRKKDSLMASFRSVVNRQLNQGYRSAGKGEDYKPTWFAYERMASFLNKRKQTSVKIKTEESSPTHEEENYFIETDSVDYMNSTDMDEETETTPGTTSLNDLVKVEMESPKKRKRRNSEDVKAENEIESSSYYNYSKRPITTAEKDLCSLYGELVTKRLRELNDMTRDIAINKIDNVLFEMKMTMYEDKKTLNEKNIQP